MEAIAADLHGSRSEYRVLEDKVVMITGVGAGLGQALASAFVERGSTVIGIARTEESLGATRSESISSDRFLGFVMDVADYAQVQGTVQTALQRTKRIDILFNNAAIYPRESFLDESAETWARAMAVNVNGVANCCKAVLPSMVGTGFGRIYNVGSFADIAPIPASAAYSASKGAVRALTKAIAADLQALDLDIEVHEWIPGHLKTRMSGFTGIQPAVSAQWAIGLASQSHARMKNCIFENDKEWLPPKPLRERLKERLFFWKRTNSDTARSQS